ncbi:hypothetical protein [Micromonospora sp. S4605]|nr:hypothetical protein [Micromonospora sp. S4605]
MIDILFALKDVIADWERRTSGLSGLLTGYLRSDRAVPVGAC